MQSRSRWAFPVLVFLTICGAAILYATRAVDETSFATITNESTSELTERNQQLAEEVADALRAAPVKGRDIEIETQDGIVKLTGRIVNAAQKDHVTSVLSQITGVVQVDNQLVVMQPAAVENRIDQAASTTTEVRPAKGSEVPPGITHTKIRHGVTNQVVTYEVSVQLANARLSGYDIEVRYERGVARLQGTVSQEDDIQRVTSLATAVPGVLAIDNQIQYRSIAPDEQDQASRCLQPTPYFTLCFWPHGTGLPHF